MLGARLVTVQELFGHSDPKITERRLGHLLPEVMKAEVDRLSGSRRREAAPKREAGTLPGSGTIPAS
jgi:integrase